MRTSLPHIDGNNESLNKLYAELARLNSTPTVNTKTYLQKYNEREMEESVRQLCSRLRIIASTLTIFINKVEGF